MYPIGTQRMTMLQLAKRMGLPDDLPSKDRMFQLVLGNVIYKPRADFELDWELSPYLDGNRDKRNTAMAYLKKINLMTY